MILNNTEIEQAILKATEEFAATYKIHYDARTEEMILNAMRERMLRNKEEVVRNLTDDDLMHNAIRFGLTAPPEKENGGMSIEDSQKYKKTFFRCVCWLRDNYKATEIDWLIRTIN